MFMIEGSECVCGKKVVSKRNTCPECKRPMKDAKFENIGKILTHTTLYAPPLGFEGPIRLCMVELSEGAHLLCGYEGEKDPVIGDLVLINKVDDLYICMPKK
jgi:uncharacterized OB-fold protein